MRKQDKMKYWLYSQKFGFWMWNKGLWCGLIGMIIKFYEMYNPINTTLSKVAGGMVEYGAWTAIASLLLAIVSAFMVEFIFKRNPDVKR